MRQNTDRRIDQLRKDFEEFSDAVNRLSSTWDSELFKNLKHRLASLQKKLAEIQNTTKGRRRS
jgi:hypothetical protein